MQAAAPQALITNGTTAESTGKPSGRHDAEPHAKVAFHKVLGAKATNVARSGAGDRSSVLAALEEALKKHLPAAKKRAPGAGDGTASKHAEGALRHSADVGKLPVQTVPAEEVGEPVPGRQEKKKLAVAARHVDGLAAGALAVAAGLSSGIKGSSGVRHDPALTLKNPSDQPTSVPLIAARKTPDIRVHILDVRKKVSHASMEDTTAAAKAQRPAPSDKDAPAPFVTKGGGSPESLVHEPRRQSPPVPAQTAGALERLREMAGAELTRAAGIVLRDGGGEIKLLLKPESLGSVRIRMNLVDNAIEGRIIVDNPSVKHVFEGSLSSLVRALTAEGFQSASLQVSVGGQGADEGKPDKEPTPRIRRVAAAGFEGNVPGVENMNLGDLLVNLFV